MWIATSVLLLVCLIHGSVSSSMLRFDCGENEELMTCGMKPSCQPTCNGQSRVICAKKCVPNQCRCIDGYIRNENAQCIPQSECPVIRARSTQASCDANEISVSCAPPMSCQKTCESKSRIRMNCPRMCIPDGCICELGFVRVSAANSTCIPQTACP